MQNLFRRFEKCAVEYLLISGQASVIYGAATFSEDVDIWIRPTAQNIQRLTSALKLCRARVYKLTPPLDLRFFLYGHGFHFTIPSNSSEIYLDVMGKPPRTSSFSRALKRSKKIATTFGKIPVVSIEDLVEVKKTDRLADYDIISNLVRIRVEQEPKPSSRLLYWALGNTFRTSDLIWLLNTFTVKKLPKRKAVQLAKSANLDSCEIAIAAEITKLRQANIKYWRPVLNKLKQLRSDGRLLKEGTPVSNL